MPTATQIEGIIQPLVAAFPVLGEFVDQMVRPILAQQQQFSSQGGNPMDMFQSVMQNVLAPLLTSMGKSTDGADINGPIQQILDGFNGLAALADHEANDTMTEGRDGGQSGDVGVCRDQMML
jgi:hypothetical protein